MGHREVRNSAPLASVVILNYNGLEYLTECLTSVLQQDYPAFEVILVDNNSTDGSGDFVAAHFPSVRIIRNKENEGYARGNNRGIEQSRGEYVVILNFDTVVARGWLSGLVSAMEENKSAGAAMSKILLFGQDNKINSDGNELSFLGFGWCGNYGQPDSGNTSVREAAYPSGASMILRRSVLERIGLFDEDYFMSQEDAELGLRIRLAGYTILCVPSSVVYHKYSFNRRGGKRYFLERDRLMLLMKIFQKKTLILILPAFLVTEAGTILYALKGGWFFPKIKTYAYLLRNLPHILIQRRRIQKSRVVGDGKILEWLRGGVYFPEVQNPLLNRFLNPFLEAYLKLLKKAYQTEPK